MKPAPQDPPEIIPTLWAGVRNGRTAWDVGANCGQTLGLLTARFENVIAFEPSEECWPFLDRYDVTVLPIAVSDHEGTVDLAVLPDKIDTGQLVSPGTHGMEWEIPPEVATRAVPCNSIDQLAARLGPPDFIKVDVEGHEAKVLAGAAEVLTHEKPEWLIEFHAPELLEYCISALEEFGYSIDIVRHPHYPEGGQMWHQHGWIRARA